MSEKKNNRLPLIAIAALPLTLGLVFAQNSGTQRVQPTQPSQIQAAPRGNQQGQTQAPRQQSGTNYADVFLQKLAAQLGISVDKLKAAAVTAGGSTIDQGVKAGDFPSDMAQNMKQDLQQNPFALAGGHGHGRGGRGDMDGASGGFGGPQGGQGPQGQAGQQGQAGGQGGPRMGMGRGTVGAAVAKTLGLSEQDLMTQLQSGKTITDLAKAGGVSTASIHAAAVAALKTDLATAVKDGRLTQAGADQMLQQAGADANFGLQFGGRGGRGMRGGNPNGSVQQGTDPSGVAATTDGI